MVVPWIESELHRGNVAQFAERAGGTKPTRSNLVLFGNQ
jgi:hypothetical protein